MSALILWIERCISLLRSGHSLQSWIVEEDSLSLAAFHHKESRPLLVEASAFSIDESGHCLHLGASCRGAARQRLGQSQTGRGHLRYQRDIERYAPYVIHIRERL